MHGEHHTYLQEEKPVRWILYSLVRIIFSIEPDDPEKDEFTVEDIVDWFDPDSSPGTGFPWFDEETSRYQITYEKNRRVESDGSKPNPVSCNNDNKRFDKFCIGIDNCDYSIYRSLPFKDEVYDRLESE